MAIGDRPAKAKKITKKQLHLERQEKRKVFDKYYVLHTPHVDRLIRKHGLPSTAFKFKRSFDANDCWENCSYQTLHRGTAIEYIGFPTIVHHNPIDLKDDGTPIYGYLTKKIRQAICGCVHGLMRVEDPTDNLVPFTFTVCRNIHVNKYGRCTKHTYERDKMSKGTWRQDQYGAIFRESFGEKLNKVLADPSLQTLDVELAIVDKRLRNLLLSLSNEDTSDKHWRILADYAEELNSILDPDGNYPTEEMQKIVNFRMHQIVGSILKVREEKEIWNEIYRATKEKKEMTLAQATVKKTGENTFTAEQVAKIIISMVQSVNKHVKDDMIKSLLHRDFNKASTITDGMIFDAEFEVIEVEQPSTSEDN